MTLQLADMSAAISGGGPVLSGTVSTGGNPVSSVAGGKPITLTLSVADTYTSVTWAVDPNSIPGFALAGSGLVRTFTTPYLQTGQGDAVINATVVDANGTAVYQFAATVYPHTSWYLNAGGTWLPEKALVQL